MSSDAAVVAGERAFAEQLVDVSRALRRAAHLLERQAGIGRHREGPHALASAGEELPPSGNVPGPSDVASSKPWAR